MGTWQKLKSTLHLGGEKARETGEEVGGICLAPWLPYTCFYSSPSELSPKRGVISCARQLHGRPWSCHCARPCCHLCKCCCATAAALLSLPLLTAYYPPSHFAAQATEYAYDQAAGLRNRAGESWDEAMDRAYRNWEASPCPHFAMLCTLRC